MMKVALIQSNILWNNISGNHLLLEKCISNAATFGSQLVVLPEMFNTGFSLPQGKLAQEANILGREFMSKQSKLYGISIVGSLPDPTEDPACPFNTMYLVSPNSEIVQYSKIHLFGYGGETEKYKAGNQTVTTQIGEMQVSLFICYDLRFPNVFFNLALQTDIYIICANWPVSRQLHWESLLRARAIENLAYVIGVNRVGQGGDLDYAGGSQVISPLGEVLVHAKDTQTTVYTDIDLNAVREARAKFPFLQDRKNM